MSRGTFRRKVVALAAAYAVALQGLFAAFVPVAAATPLVVLCSGEQPDGPAAPHEPSCTSACAMLGSVGAPVPPSVLISAPLSRSAHAPSLFEIRPIAAPKGPQSARAPPLV